MYCLFSCFLILPGQKVIQLALACKSFSFSPKIISKGRDFENRRGKGDIVWTQEKGCLVPFKSYNIKLHCVSPALNKKGIFYCNSKLCSLCSNIRHLSTWLTFKHMANICQICLKLCPKVQMWKTKSPDSCFLIIFS